MSPEPSRTSPPLSLAQLHIPEPSPADAPAPSSSSLLLPIPSGNQSTSSFTFPDAQEIDDLPPDIATADISIAPDGSFVETSSGPAARELKRRYDQRLGVNARIRSPYAITALVNQHGKQVYRIGHRDAIAPGASAVEAEHRMSSPSVSKHSNRSKRVSVNALLSSVTSFAPSPQPPRKLRKTRSIPDNLGSEPEQSVTGRAHAHSVSGGMPRFPHQPPGPRCDIFESAMHWTAAKPSDGEPFGPGVCFDAPRQPVMEYLPMPHGLREMQSFESGLTATPHSPTKPTYDTPTPTRFSPAVFDVLQTSRGLPLLDRISPDAGETTVIKISARGEDDVAPRDDPRFVIWGATSDTSGDDEQKSGKGEEPRVLLAATVERWLAQLTSELDYEELLIFLLTYRTYISSIDLLHLLICRFHWALGTPSSSIDQRARQVARLRTFVAMRFWILTFFAEDFLPNRELRLELANWWNTLIKDPVLQKHRDGQSTMRHLKKAIKQRKAEYTRKTRPPSSSSSPPKPKKPHLLGDKFAEAVGLDAGEDSDLDLDFVPDETDDVDSPVRTTPSKAAQSPAASTNGAFLSPESALQQTILQQQRHHSMSAGPVAEAPHGDLLPIHHGPIQRALVKTLGRLGRWKRVLHSGSAVNGPLGACADVSAFDLELNESGDLLTVRGGVESYLKVLDQQPVKGLPKEKVTGWEEPRTPTRNVSATSAKTFVDDEPRTPQSARRIVPSSTPASVSDVEKELPPVLDISAAEEPLAAPSEDISSPPADPPASPTQLSPRKIVSELADHDGVPVEEVAVEMVDAEPQRPSLRATDRRDPNSSSPRGSLRSSSSSEYGSVIRRQGSGQGWQFDVVSIDDLDLSDTSSDAHVDADAAPAHPPGLRRAPRKLPLRRDFEFVRRSGESVSSMGISHPSYASQSTSSIVSDASAERVLGDNLQPWQMQALVESLSDEEEAGDVEDALRRLEGQINPSKRQEKATKVDHWVENIRARVAAGETGGGRPSSLSDEEQDEVRLDSASASDGESRPSSLHLSQSGDVAQQRLAVEQNGTHLTETVTTPVASSSKSNSQATSPTTSPRDLKPQPDEAVPAEILQSRMPSRPSTSDGPKKVVAQNSTRVSPASRFVPHSPRVHRSFILNYRAEVLVQHFALIDRELFMGIKFDEVVLGDWMTIQEVNVLDWAQYLKDRARWKAEHRLAEKTSALAAVRARFNLMATFVLSEIVLTPPGERHLVAAKFIRMAWKAYALSSYNTLVAIVTGLESEWVTKAMGRSWGRVGIWETRMFNDLKIWTSSAEDFKYIKQAIAAIEDAPTVEDGSRAPSIISASDGPSGSSKASDNKDHKPKPPPTCVPFLGVYLSQLHRFNQLPDLVDPTAPNRPVPIDPVTGNFDPPAHPEVFSSLAPLPSTMQLEPLINVQKQRLIAGVVKSLVSGQHLASRVQYPVDRKLFQKCLKLRGLDSETLQRVLGSVP